MLFAFAGGGKNYCEMLFAFAGGGKICCEMLFAFAGGGKIYCEMLFAFAGGGRVCVSNTLYYAYHIQYHKRIKHAALCFSLNSGEKNADKTLIYCNVEVMNNGNTKSQLLSSVCCVPDFSS